MRFLLFWTVLAIYCALPSLEINIFIRCWVTCIFNHDTVYYILYLDVLCVIVLILSWITDKSFSICNGLYVVSLPVMALGPVNVDLAAGPFWSGSQPQAPYKSSVRQMHTPAPPTTNWHPCEYRYYYIKFSYILPLLYTFIMQCNISLTLYTVI